MEEFTNGTSLTFAYRRPRSQGATAANQAHCPYCGWDYDHPEHAVPDHATCQHLIAVAYWTEESTAQSSVAIVTPRSTWKCWAQGDVDAGRKKLEHTLRRLQVKVESSTATGLDSNSATPVTSRYYFARRSGQAVAELSDTSSDCNMPVEMQAVSTFRFSSVPRYDAL